MKCSKAHRLISEQIDNSLPLQQAERLQDHLKTCQACSTLLIEMKQVVAQASSLETLVPPADSWTSIKKQLKRSGRGQTIAKRMLEPFWLRLRHPVLAPMMVCIAVLMITVYWFKPVDFRESGKTGRTVMTSEHFKAIQVQYLEVIDLLNREIFAQQLQLNPQLVNIFKENLAVIDASIASLRTVVDHHPAGAAANTYLLLCYQEKIDVLNQIRDTIH